jgi:hypothetical protein
MLAGVLGLVVAIAGLPLQADVEFTAGASTRIRGESGSYSGGGHLGVHLVKDFDRAIVEASVSLIVVAPFTLRDLGSFVTVGGRFDGFLRELRLEVSPFNTYSRLPGFDWANIVGLAPAETFTPAMTLEARTTVGTVWATTRIRTLLNTLTNSNEVRPDVLFGVDVPFPDHGLELNLRGAWLQYGLVPSLGPLGVRLESRALVGAARLAWTLNEPVGPAVDLLTYTGDPTRFDRFFIAEPRTLPLAATVLFEGGVATQRLSNRLEPHEQLAGWVDLQARLRLEELRLFATLRCQSTSLIAFDVPGVPPFFAFAANELTETMPQLAGFVGVDWRWASLNLRPGVMVSVTRSASVVGKVNFDANPPPGLEGPRTLLLDRQGLGILPVGWVVRPRMNVKASLSWSPVSAITALVFVDVEKDWNDEGYFFGVMRPDIFTVRGELQLQARL